MPRRRPVLKHVEVTPQGVFTVIHEKSYHETLKGENVEVDGDNIKVTVDSQDLGKHFMDVAHHARMHEKGKLNHKMVKALYEVSKIHAGKNPSHAEHHNELEINMAGTEAHRIDKGIHEKKSVQELAESKLSVKVKDTFTLYGAQGVDEPKKLRGKKPHKPVKSPDGDVFKNAKEAVEAAQEISAAINSTNSTETNSVAPSPSPTPASATPTPSPTPASATPTPSPTPETKEDPVALDQIISILEKAEARDVLPREQLKTIYEALPDGAHKNAVTAVLSSVQVFYRQEGTNDWQIPVIQNKGVLLLDYVTSTFVTEKLPYFAAYKYEVALREKFKKGTVEQLEAVKTYRASPTNSPTADPTDSPTAPTNSPTADPTNSPTAQPTASAQMGPTGPTGPTYGAPPAVGSEMAAGSDRYPRYGEDEFNPEPEIKTRRRWDRSLLRFAGRIMFQQDKDKGSAGQPPTPEDQEQIAAAGALWNQNKSNCRGTDDCHCCCCTSYEGGQATIDEAVEIGRLDQADAQSRVQQINNIYAPILGDQGPQGALQLWSTLSQQLASVEQAGENWIPGLIIPMPGGTLGGLMGPQQPQQLEAPQGPINNEALLRELGTDETENNDETENANNSDGRDLRELEEEEPEGNNDPSAGTGTGAGDEDTSGTGAGDEDTPGTGDGGEDTSGDEDQKAWYETGKFSDVVNYFNSKVDNSGDRFRKWMNQYTGSDQKSQDFLQLFFKSMSTAGGLAAQTSMNAWLRKNIKSGVARVALGFFGAIVVSQGFDWTATKVLNATLEATNLTNQKIKRRAGYKVPESFDTNEHFSNSGMNAFKRSGVPHHLLHQYPEDEGGDVQDPIKTFNVPAPALQALSNRATSLDGIRIKS